MNKLGTISNIYFIGIGGIGMSALARHFNFLGVKVSGYDKMPSALSRELEVEGISIHYEDNISLLDKNASIVVYTPAIPADHGELKYYINHNYTVLKRSDVLELLTQHSYNICIAGTHGKTTVSTMVAHILRDSGVGCTAFLGGISVNYKTNYWTGDSNICVVEADEYDRSFLKLSPDIASISAMDPDHLDIYGTAEAVEDAFIEFAGNVKKRGILIIKYGLNRSGDFKNPHLITYSLTDERADVYVTNLTTVNGGYSFDINSKGKEIRNFELNIGGMHNVENAALSIQIALEKGLDPDTIKKAVSTFRGVKRRFEYVVKNNKNGHVYIDDYAHHPEELRALISSAKQLFPDKKCCVIFQPHLFSRTKDLASEFAASLDLADQVILLPIYPARELPMQGVSSTLILEKMAGEEKQILAMDEIGEWMKTDTEKCNDKLYITAGAGAIDILVKPFEIILSGINNI